MKDFRIWNSQFIKYAGYKQPDGTVVGDPFSVQMTQICESLGWKGEGGPFDVLPLVLQASGQEPELFVIPPDLIMEVQITHPKYPWFEELGLRWYCLPAVSNMIFDVGGVEFPCAPFNGWYMSTEIGARNFGDVARYNMLKPVALRMGLDTRSNTSLWKDQALIELNIAVLHSFNASGATIMDHHTASESFMKHLENEEKLRGGCPADWVWIVPPISGSICPVFHQEMLAYTVKPTFDYQEDPFKYFPIDKKEGLRKRRFGFKEVAKAVKLTAKLMGEAMKKRHKAIILYATETGKSENYARILGDLFSHAFDPKVMCMGDFNFPELEHEQLVLIVTSTFGNGEAPSNGESFGELLYKLKHPPPRSAVRTRRLSNIHIQQYNSIDRDGGDSSQPLANLRFSVFGLGSRAYPHFCAFAHSCRNLIVGLGGEEVFPIGEGDELCGQEESFMSWAKDVFKAACETFCTDFLANECVDSLAVSSTSWKKGRFRYVVDEANETAEQSQGLELVHHKKVYFVEVISKEKLQHPDSSRSTILVRMSTGSKQELSYVPGDHLAVFPENREELVDTLIDLLDDAPDPDAPLRMELCKEVSGPFGPIKKWEVMKRLPDPCTLREALTRYLDIATPPTPQLLAQLAMQATDQKEKEKLEELGKGSSLYEDWKFYRFPNLVEVLQEFPSVKADVMLILTQLPLLQSRYYSISSSPLLYPNEVHITVAVVNYRTQGGQGPLHHGVCSTWLNSLHPGDAVPVRIRSAPSFHLPDDKFLPVIMIGPGTGIAPFRAFWQQRFYEIQNGTMKEDLGPIELYFGCRTSKLDFIYKDELQEMSEGGVLDGLHTAFSREPGQPKQYVQDLLKKNYEQICELILLNGGHIFVCGDVSMASDVSNTLLNLLQEFAALSQVEAQELMAQLRSSGRYHEDIFGVTLRTAEVTDRVRSAAKRAWSFVGGPAKQDKVAPGRRHTQTRIEGVSTHTIYKLLGCYYRCLTDVIVWFIAFTVINAGGVRTDKEQHEKVQFDIQEPEEEEEEEF
eukprot:gene15605-6882_t